MANIDPTKLLRPDLGDFPPYVPSTVAVADMERVIKLDANENPFGPSPRALAALAATHTWNRYATQDELRPLIAQYVGVPPDHIIVGNGADEVIDLIQRVVLSPGDAILDCPPSFEMYGKYALVNGARVLEVPRDSDFRIDIDAIERLVAGENVKLVFVANPNNPDGGLTPPAVLGRLLALPALVVLDEAYAEFASGSVARRVPEQPNLVVLRTFSKWAGLAGLRIGYAIAPLAIADRVLRTKSPYNVNAAAIVAARASLEDAAFLQANVRRIIAERDRLVPALARTGLLQPLPTQTNFILCRVNRLAPRALRDALAQRGILIRAFSSPRLQDYIRISVGTPEQDDTLLAALGEIGAAANA